MIGRKGMADITAERANPTHDVLSELTGGDLADEELKGVSPVLSAAGFDTAANTPALDAFALLRDPERLAALRAALALADSAAEELLRYPSAARTFMGTALENVELGGRTVEAGTTVILSLNTIDRDPERFTDPRVLDADGREGGHPAFVRGIHQCPCQSRPASRCGSRCPRCSTDTPRCGWQGPPSRSRPDRARRPRTFTG
ncbi:cytochrome P450 [Nocardiopsis sp. RV163]|uniref:cytochrome P450 n=1 Tax=Nocardiopsis sp. RV163 TaxID=1661388 RepID=UPI000A9C3E35